MPICMHKYRQLNPSFTLLNTCLTWVFKLLWCREFQHVSACMQAFSDCLWRGFFWPFEKKNVSKLGTHFSTCYSTVLKLSHELYYKDFEPIVQVYSPSDFYEIEYVLHTFCLTQTKCTWVQMKETVMRGLQRKTINTIGFTHCFLWIWLLTCIICSEWNFVWRLVPWFSACI